MMINDVMQNFHFLRPEWSWLLILPLIFYFFVAKSENALSSWANVCDKNLLNFLLIKGQNKQRKLPIILTYVISFLLILAILAPTWNKKNNPTLSVDNPVVVMLNMSSDMWAKDVTPSRIVRAKYVIQDLMKSLNGTENGLIVYSNEPFMISPLAEDVNIINNLL